MTTKEILKKTGATSKKVLVGTKKRIFSKTPKKLVKWRNIALVIAGVGGVVLTAPVSLPAGLLAVAPYMVWVGNAAAGLIHSWDVGD